jgi:hypothetical protein
MCFIGSQLVKRGAVRVGVDYVRTDANGLVTEFSVMMRPLKAITSLATAVAAGMPEGPRKGPVARAAADLWACDACADDAVRGSDYGLGREREWGWKHRAPGPLGVGGFIHGCPGLHSFLKSHVHITDQVQNSALKLRISGLYCG